MITIKGFLYELGQAQTEKKKKAFLPHVAKTIVWIDRLHKEKKLHNLKNLKKDERVALVNKTIGFIMRVLSEYYPDLDPREEIIRWITTGEKVIAKYKETTINKKIIVEYTLELKK